MSATLPMGARTPVPCRLGESSVPPNSFIDYQSLELMLDTVCHQAFAFMAPGREHLRFSTASVQDFVGVFQVCLSPSLESYGSAINMLQMVLPAVLELRDFGKLKHPLNMHTFSKLLWIDELKEIVTHLDLSVQARSSLSAYLKACDDKPGMASGGGLEMLAGDHFGLFLGDRIMQSSVMRVWSQIVDEYLFSSANRLQVVGSRDGGSTYRRAVRDYANLADQLPYVEEMKLIFFLRAAGVNSADFLPHFSLAARAAVFSEDLGL
jgi:hypothetical protein